MKPVYWKPKYATRRMHERAAAKQQLAREEAVRRSARTSWLDRLLARFRRK